MIDNHSVTAHWNGDFSEEALRNWAKELRSKLTAPRVSLGLVFISPRFFSQAENILEILQLHAQIPLLVGCSGNALICGSEEIEESPGLTLGLYHLPGADLRAYHFDQDKFSSMESPEDWHLASGVPPGESSGWLVFADPFNLDTEGWLQSWSKAYPGQPVLGGLASGVFTDQTTQVYLNTEVFEEGGIALSVGGGVKLASVISQGCTPIGDTWTLTRVERNFIQGIANRPAYEVLAETFNSLPAEEQVRSHGNLFIGLAMNEYLEDFQRGDFLIRNLLGADPASGAVAVGAMPRAGQTIQFQRRDAAAASEDMKELLIRAKEKLAGTTIYGGCLCSCSGRGKNLFGAPNHDAALVQSHLGELGLTGFFCNGELGPVGQKNFIHGYTAALALFVKK